MRPWSLAIAIIAGLAIVALLAAGSDERSFATQARAGANVRPAFPLTSVAALTGPEEVIVLIRDRGLLPPEVEDLLAETHDLVQAAENQEPDDARESLEESLDKLDEAMDLIDEEIDDTSNLATRMQLGQIQAALMSVEDEIEARLEQL